MPEITEADIPTPARLFRAAMQNKAILAALARPVAGLEHYCTEAAVKAERPVAVVYQYGYVVCTAFDCELSTAELPGAGAFIEVRPLEPEDEWHPERIRYVYQATLPKSKIGKAAGKPDKPPRKPRAKAVAAPSAQSSEPLDDAALAAELGLL